VPLRTAHISSRTERDVINETLIIKVHFIRGLIEMIYRPPGRDVLLTLSREARREMSRDASSKNHNFDAIYFSPRD